jgi:hypothetical protein
VVLPDPAPVAQPAETLEPPGPVPQQPAPLAEVERTATPSSDTKRTNAAPDEPAARSRPDLRTAASEAPTPVASRERAPMLEAPAASGSVAPRVETARREDSGTNELAFAGVLGALGLAGVGGIALLASRRRRKELAQPASQAVDESAIDSAARSGAEPAAAMPSATPRQPIPPVVQGDPVPLPARMPTTFAERDALLKRLIAAPPDKANPFTSPRARARRAKLILQSLDRRFQTRKPRIDLSEYTNRWPSLRGWQPATA